MKNFGYNEKDWDNNEGELSQEELQLALARKQERASSLGSGASASSLAGIGVNALGKALSAGLGRPQGVVEEGANFLNGTGPALRLANNNKGIAGGGITAGGMSTNWSPRFGVISDEKLKKDIDKLSSKETSLSSKDYDAVQRALSDYDERRNKIYNDINQLDKKGAAGRELKEELLKEVNNEKRTLRAPGNLMESQSLMPQLLPQDDMTPMDIAQKNRKILANSIPDFNREKLRNTIGVKRSDLVFGPRPSQKMPQVPTSSSNTVTPQSMVVNKDAANAALKRVMDVLMGDEGVDAYDLDITHQEYGLPVSTGPDNVIPSGRKDTSDIRVSGSKQDVKETRTKMKGGR